ncbi:MAG: DUF501 domain-containing protein [Coriobacteriia bacterium]|nr:DUF501 domain-containing protein [Coriobacteriia bacterium]
MATARPADAACVARQLGRTPRSPWRVAVRCARGCPQVIASPPLLDDGTPFPTWLYLTCPALCHECATQESKGLLDTLRAQLAADATLRADLLAADARFRAGRSAEAAACGQGATAAPGAGTGLAGQADPTALKCLHAHVAYQLAGLQDPFGARILNHVPNYCPTPPAICSAK